jgi:hypothetical protein
MRQVLVYFDFVENPHFSNPNPVLPVWASLYYLRGLPNTSVEIGNKYRFVTWK